MFYLAGLIRSTVLYPILISLISGTLQFANWLTMAEMPPIFLLVRFGMTLSLHFSESSHALRSFWKYISSKIPPIIYLKTSYKCIVAASGAYVYYFCYTLLLLVANVCPYDYRKDIFISSMGRCRPVCALRMPTSAHSRLHNGWPCVSHPIRWWRSPGQTALPGAPGCPLSSKGWCGVS